jgi:hypothetical protein
MGDGQVSVQLKSTRLAVTVWGTPDDRFDVVQPIKSDDASTASGQQQLLVRLSATGLTFNGIGGFNTGGGSRC